MRRIGRDAAWRIEVGDHSVGSPARGWDGVNRALVAMGTAGALDPVQVRAHARQAPWQDRARAGEVGRQATGLRYRPHGVLVDPVERGLFADRSEEHTSELQSHSDLVCRLLLEKKK